MKLIVNHEELKVVSNNLKDDSNTIDNELNNMYNELSNLENIWQGKDASIFINKAKNYIELLRTIPDFYLNINKIIDQTDEVYISFDKEYAESLNKAVVTNE